MPALFNCIHCGQPHTTAGECHEHEAECPWRIKGFQDKELRACPTCGGLDSTGGRFCTPKGGALIAFPVTLCRWWTNPSKPCTACGNTGVAAEDGDTCPNCSGKTQAPEARPQGVA